MGTSFLQLISEFSPIATIALALVIIYQLVQNAKNVDTLSNNHLSGLPDMHDSLMRMETKLDKINDTLVEIKTLLKK